MGLTLDLINVSTAAAVSPAKQSHYGYALFLFHQGSNAWSEMSNASHIKADSLNLHLIDLLFSTSLACYAQNVVVGH